MPEGAAEDQERTKHKTQKPHWAISFSMCLFIHVKHVNLFSYNYESCMSLHGPDK